MKILFVLFFILLITNETLQKLDAQKVNTIKHFLRNLVQTSINNFKQKLAVEMRQREEQNLAKKQNRKLFFGFFRHKKKKHHKKVQSKKSSSFEPLVLSRTVDYSLQNQNSLGFADIYKRVEKEITIEKIVDSIVEEGFGEEIIWYLKRKLRQKRRRQRQQEVFPKYHFDYFENLNKSQTHQHKKKRQKKNKDISQRSPLFNDPLLELYSNSYPEEKVLKTQPIKVSQNKEDDKKLQSQEMKELDDFLNNYYKDATLSENKEQHQNNFNEVFLPWGFKKRI